MAMASAAWTSAGACWPDMNTLPVRGTEPAARLRRRRICSRVRAVGQVLHVLLVVNQYGLNSGSASADGHVKIRVNPPKRHGGDTEPEAA